MRKINKENFDDVIGDVLYELYELKILIDYNVLMFKNFTLTGDIELTFNNGDCDIYNKDEVIEIIKDIV